ncbi:NAD(P)H-dependent oxidoreductase [Vibrio sp. Vb1018]|uniref:NADPH-dependent FMN reductase n=1 Tax=Vibrio sp. Vb1018 TaxID=3074636 RepID=UPI002963E7AE|nr:NAD(P)H-dependent oxidoreductase [Vibrio sp. Vb1018]MDW1822989.1 NAD(P)H-dependent oxidoreductase [Vibrio sp. Vb1018]
MKLTIVSGSQRANSQSLNVARFLKQHGLQEFDQVEILDLHELNLPFWNEGVWQGIQEWDVWTPIAQKLQESNAFVFITPEWHGMATPALKNFLLLTTANELAHKPALLVSVSVSINGVYPISELRMTGSKNNHVCFLPDHLIVRNSDKLIDQDANSDDSDFVARTQYTLKLLSCYASALAPVHQDMLPLGKPFTYGM